MAELARIFAIAHPDVPALRAKTGTVLAAAREAAQAPGPQPATPAAA